MGTMKKDKVYEVVQVGTRVDITDLMLIRPSQVCKILSVSYPYLRTLVKRFPVLKPVKIDEKSDGRPVLRHRLVDVQAFIEQYNDY